MTLELHHEITPRILASGLSHELADQLDERLGTVGVLRTDDPDEAMREIARGDYSLLIINHTLSGPPAMDVLSRVRANPNLVDLPVLYLLDRNLDSQLGRKLLEQLGVRRLLLHPIDADEVVRQAEQFLVRSGAPAGNGAAAPNGGEAHSTLMTPDVASPAVVSHATEIEGVIPAAPSDVDTEHAHVLVVEDDRDLADRLATEAVARGMRAEVASSPEIARELIGEELPDVVLLDLAFPNGSDDGIALLKELGRQVPPVPVLVLTASDTFLDRVQVASLGGRGFLQKTLPAPEVLDAVTRLFQQLRTSESRVLAVDDDPVILASLRSLLVPQGIQLTTLDDPLRFWDTLEQATPDLLMLDLDMPRLSGIELCRVVRNDARWSALPVLFLTQNSDPDTVRRVFAAGADDFVGKPIVGPELLTKITNRLERTLLYRSMAEIDPMTGVSNRRKSTQTLRQFLRLAERHKQPLSIALLDVDHFKQINDRFGHGTGDAVLQQLGTLLMRTFRSEDVVARWGGEEFLVGMYGMTRVDGVQRLTDLLETLRHESLAGPRGERIRLSFSAGVAQFPDDGTDVQSLYRAADAALYRAKAAGRDRVMAVGWTTEEQAREIQNADVIVIDDDEVLGSLLVHALETKGYRTHWIKDGESAALSLAGAEPTLTAPVILLDIDLPDLDGLAVLRRLARDGILRQSRVIALSSRGHVEQGGRAMELGAFDHVAKPFSLPVLLQRVRRALEIL
jgi:diguanylate cyclase (GGDEF)-like protein